MKKVLLLLSIIISLTTQAQWELRYYVDEFGDKTEETYMYMRASGTFSNSATQNSKCIYDFVDSGESLEVHVKEYGNRIKLLVEMLNQLRMYSSLSQEYYSLIKRHILK
jgi:hypothetical protein